MKLASSLIIFFLLVVGCTTTIAPKSVESSGASYDNGERNSGFIGWATNSSAIYGVLTFHAHERYNELIDIYGSKFIPPLKNDYGIINNKTNYWISLEGLSNFAKMNRWRKSGVIK